MDRDWTVDFVRRFEDHQVERIRRAIVAYRAKHKLRDVRLTKEILKYLPENVTYDSTLKNVYRLRTGERIRGATFLNACVQFLQVEMATPPEEDLGLAMKLFVGNVFGYSDLWNALAGDYVLRVLRERDFSLHAAVGEIGNPVRVMSLRPKGPEPQLQASFVVVSISPGEGMDYGVAHERFFFRDNKGAEDEEAELSEANTLSRKGVCLPIGKQDFLIMMRDFMFSHMYVLRRETFGFGGTMIMPSVYDFLSADIPKGLRRTQYDVALHRVPRT